MLRFMNAANAITLLGLCAALGAMLLASAGHLAYGLCGLVVAGLCDVLDGQVARRLERSEEEQTFGKRLDSLVDACAFGVAPVFLFQAAGMRTAPEYAALALFTCCAIWRLAFFDTRGFADEEEGRRYYAGVPTTFVALAIPLAFLAGLHSAQALRIAANVLAVALALAMIGPLKFPKPRGLAILVLLLLAVGFVVAYGLLGARFPAT